MNILRNFEKNVEQRRDEVMLHSFSCDKAEWTYGEVNKEAEKTAACLTAKGVKRGDVCMVCMNDYCKLFITVIALIRTGVVFVIVDPQSPDKMIDYKIRDAGCSYIITDDEYRECNADPRRELSALSICYTSGTTGEPKGVQRSVDTFENTLINAEALIDDYGCKSILMSANPWFGVYLGLMLPMALSTDGVVFIPNREIMTSLDLMHRVIRDYNIEHCFMSPSYLLNYYENYDKHNLKLVYTTGDKLRLKKYPGFDVLTQYGQTESGPLARIILKSQDDLDRIEIQKGTILGKPILNVQAYIVDDDGNLLEPNKTGRICVSGPQSEYRMSATGDYGYMDENGVLYMTGRNDTVVNINGQRVDTADVEAVIGRLGFVTDCRVLTAQDRYGENYLIAYCVCEDGVEDNEIRGRISLDLPGYCVPRHIMVLDSFPLNSNGKVDKTKLPAPRYTSVNYIEPSGDTERIIIRIISELISTDENRIGACDSFNELGMDSLMFSMLLIRLEDEFSIELAYRDIVESRDIRTLALCIESSEDRKPCDYSDVTIAKKQEVSGPPLSIILECLLRNHEDTAYNNTIIIPFEEKPDIDRLNQAIMALIKSQEVLHSVFRYDGRTVYRELLDDVDFRLEIVTVDSCDWDDIKNNLATPFELWDSLMYRIKLYKVLSENDEKYCLMFDCHHSISDQHSNKIFLNELMRFYEENAIPVANNYLPFDETDQNNERYWDEYFEKISSQPDVIADVHKKINEKIDKPVRTRAFECNRELTAKLDKFCALTGFTRANVLLTAYQIMIEKYCQHDGFAVAVPFQGRTRYVDRNTIGMFVRVLPVVYNNKGSVREILLENQFTLSGHQGHQISNLFFRKEKKFQDFVFNYINLEENCGYEVIESRNVRFKLILFYYSRPSGNDEIKIEYDTASFTDSAIIRLASYYKKILTDIIERTDESPDKFELLNNSEKQYFLNEYTGQEVTVAEGTYFELFTKAAQENKDRTALIYSSSEKEIRITYGELLSRSLEQAKVISGDAVHLVVSDDSLDTILGCFAALAAGKPFIYIDSEMPDEYRSEIISKLADVDTDDTMFYLYTSGTTGRNKIFPISNEGFVNECYGENKGYNTDIDSVVAVTAGPTFDMYYLTAFPVLLAGGTVVLFSEEYRHNIYEFDKAFRKYGVERTFMTTKLAEQYMSLIDDSPLKVLLTGGESLNKVVKRTYKLINIYGPAEAGIITRGLIDPDEEDYTIGVPVNNMKLYVVDRNGHICPYGIPGEILSGGPQLTRGYLSAGQSDDERFIDDCLGFKCSKLYKSGDIAYVSENGKIYFLGRKDRQVKVNGIRIETDTIAAVALKVDGVKQVHVMVNGTEAAGKQLVLFYTALEDRNEKLRRCFEENLPESMIPKNFYRVDEMPLNANSKTDETRLRELIVTSVCDDYVAPSTGLEKELVELTAEVMNIDSSKIGVRTELSSIGCDSLSAMALSYRIEKNYKVGINPVVFMRYTTIEDIADKLEDAYSENNVNINNGTFSDILMSYSAEENSDNVPMVFIHTGNTGSEAYLPLAEKLNPGTRFYCIENYNVLHNNCRINGVNNLAEMYCRLIKNIPNKGTFILGGWSYGGIIAHSMAAMMEDEGYNANLILLDPTRINSEEDREHYEMLKISGQSQEYLKQSPLFEKYRAMGLIEVLYENNRYVIQDILDYEPLKCQAKCIFFKAMDSNSAIMDNGFGEISGEMEIIPLYTDHDSFMKGEALEIIAENTNKLYTRLSRNLTDPEVDFEGTSCINGEMDGRY